MRSQWDIWEADAAFETEILCAKRSINALRVIARGKQRLTVYRAPQVLQRAICFTLVNEQIAKVDHKNEEIDIIYEKK